MDDAVEILENLPQIQAKLKTLSEVGLGYLHLGQSSTTLSGGEAQRIKLAKELSKRQTGKTFYLLDEPTTGLHFDDVRHLLDVLQRLVDLGNTVLVIEHHLDVIRSADYLIDMGPEGGEGGGQVVVAGTPDEVMQYQRSHTGEALRKVAKAGHAACRIRAFASGAHLSTYRGAAARGARALLGLPGFGSGDGVTDCVDCTGFGSGGIAARTEYEVGR